jgi:hypothetical protein
VETIWHTAARQSEVLVRVPEYDKANTVGKSSQLMEKGLIRSFALADVQLAPAPRRIQLYSV